MVGWVGKQNEWGEKCPVGGSITHDHSVNTLSLVTITGR